MSFRLIDLPEVRSRHIRHFATYWQGKITGGTVPQRREIDPADLKPVLPWLMIVDIEPEPFRVLYRLAGTKVVEMNQVELTGRYLDELQDASGTDYIPRGIAAYRLAWSEQRPIYGSYRWPTQSGSEYPVEFAIFPVSDTKTAGQCFALEDWDIDPAMAARRELPLPILSVPPDKTRK